MAKIKQTQIDEKYIWMGGGVLLLIIVIFAFGRTSAKRDQKNNPDANPNIKPITVNTQTGSMQWNPSALIKEIHTAFEVNWRSGRCSVLQKLVKLQDVQLIGVADGYHKQYGKTLRKVLNDAWGADCSIFDMTPYGSQIKQRMDILQIP